MMDQYLQQPTQLNNLYEPPPVPFTFETIGWEILLGVLILLLLVLAEIWIKSYRRNAYRRAALKQLNLYQQSSWKVQDVLVLLKSSAIHAYGRQRTASLHGLNWLQFLEGSGKNVQLVKLEQDIATAVYQDQSLNPQAGDELMDNARKWIKTHARKP